MEIYKLHKSEDSNWRSWIRASGKRLPRCFYQALTKLKQSNHKSAKEIIEELGITRKMLQDWVKGRRAIPLWH